MYWRKFRSQGSQRCSRPLSHFSPTTAASPAPCEPRRIQVREEVQLLFGHMLLHLLQVQVLRTFFHSEGQLLLHIVSEVLEFSLVPSLHSMSQFLPLLAILPQLPLPKIPKRLQLLLPRPHNIIIFLVMPLFHLIYPPGLQIFLELFGHQPQFFCLNVVSGLLVLVHLGESLVQHRLDLVNRTTILKRAHLFDDGQQNYQQILKLNLYPENRQTTGSWRNIGTCQNIIRYLQNNHFSKPPCNQPRPQGRFPSSHLHLVVSSSPSSSSFIALQLHYSTYNTKIIRKEMIASMMQSLFGPKVTDNEEYIRLTYRSDIQKRLPTTNYSSDTGWGCMLRVLQMALANLLCRRDHVSSKTVIPLFWDNSLEPFSIQILSQVSAQLFPHKKPCQWYSPSEAGFLMQAVLQKFNLTYRVLVCNDGSIFYNQLVADRDHLVVLVMARIGLDKPQPQYLEALIDIMGTRFFFGMLGGTPRYAHLFFKHKQGYMGMLDPHETRRAAQNYEDLITHLDEYSAKLQWVRKDKISSSMCIMFVMKGKEVDQFWTEMMQVKEKCGEGFFLYMAEEKPVYSPSNIIEILQFE